MAIAMIIAMTATTIYVIRSDAVATFCRGGAVGATGGAELIVKADSALDDP